MASYKEKIRKLLALAESPVEAEAKAALLKAKQLMAEHKLSERDCFEEENLNVKKALVGVTCTKRLNSWVPKLAGVIAENYCCRSWSRREIGKQTMEIGFIGLEDDFEICEQIFKYAVDCVLSWCKDIRKKGRDMYTGKQLSKMCDEYGFGFTLGVAEAFVKQMEKNQEWGLVLATPKAVKEMADKMTPGTLKQVGKPQSYGERLARNAGYKDGQMFDPARRLKAKGEAPYKYLSR